MAQEEGLAGDLNEKFQLLKNEVDALQIAVMSKRSPWYKNASTLISVLALLFSFGTTYVSYVRTQSQDIGNARVELRGLLQRLSYLPRDNIEMMKKYSDDPTAIAWLGSYITQENVLLGRQAAEIVRKVPPEYISATEYYTVAMALQAGFNNDGAKEFFTMAEESSKDFADKIAARRMLANLLFVDGQPEDGRVEYQKALNIFSAYPEYNDYTKKSTHIWTELSWAYAEANSGFMELAMQHIVHADNMASSLAASPGTEQMKRQITQARTILTSGSNLRPPSGILPEGGLPPLSGSR